MNDWQAAVNEASFAICVENNELIYNRTKLKILAESKARETYVFRKGSSRSKLASDGPSAKSAKLTTEERKQKVSHLSAILKLSEDQTKTTQILLAKANDMNDFAKCSRLQKEIRDLFNQKAKHQEELKGHLKQ